MSSKVFFRIAGFCLALAVMACNRKQYICPAYQSAFQLDMLAYKIAVNPNDSLALAADSTAELDVIMMLAERIRPQIVQQQTADIDSLTFPPDMVSKTQVLLMKKIKRKKKDKLIATVPMLTVFPETVDSTSGEEFMEEEQPKKKSRRAKKVVPDEYIDKDNTDKSGELDFNAVPKEGDTPIEDTSTQEEEETPAEDEAPPKREPEKSATPEQEPEPKDTDKDEEEPKKEEPF